MQLTPRWMRKQILFVTNNCMQPPVLQLVDIPDVSEEKFEGLFHVSYAGDASISLLTKVQVITFHSSKQLPPF